MEPNPQPAAELRHRGRHILGRPAGLFFIVAYKAVWGIIELSAGLLVLFSYKIILGELAEDPQDLFFNWLLGHLPFSQPGAIKVGAAVTIFGLIKLFLAIGLWFKPVVTRKIAIFLFSAIAVYGAYHLSLRFSWFTTAALAIDGCILAYFLLLLPQHLKQDKVF